MEEPKKMLSGVKSLAGGAGATVIAKLAVPVGVTYFVKCLVKAVDTTADEAASYMLQVAVRRSAAGAVALVGAVDAVSGENDATWAATLVADDVNKSINLTVTPDAANTTVFTYSMEAV